jgi:hypothetical protein
MKEPIRDPAIMERMKVVFDLYDTAKIMMRQNLRRRHPGANEAEIERRLIAWLQRRPEAEHGDAVGRPSRRFESIE